MHKVPELPFILRLIILVFLGYSIGPNLEGDWTVIPLCVWEAVILYLMQALKTRAALGSSAIHHKTKGFW
jgi:hypothetical protein